MKKRNKHNLSNYRLLTCDMGKLIPVGMIECLPGDTMQLSTSAFIRVSPLAAPVMHPVSVRLHHFFVPHRLVWSDWEKFITGGPDGLDASAIPQITVPLDGTTKKSLLDYMGIPPANTGGTISVSALPIYGVNMIWNEYYRDQDLIAPRTLSLTSVPDISWGKDYFTTARPWTQKGPEITLPLGGQAPIVGLGSAGAAPGALNIYETEASAPRAIQGWNTSIMESDGANPTYPAIYADLQNATQITVNDFRRGFALQRYQEARARYGSRYTEYLRYLGVTPSDARLQRPEFLGGGHAPLNFSEVLQTAEATPADVDRESYGVGDLYGHGIAGARHGRIRRFIEEHGYIHSFMSVRPRALYMNGVNRTWLRYSKEDFWQRELEHIGMQAINMNEILALGANGPNDNPSVFGYNDRYAEYRQEPSIVTGEFRDILKYWHLGRELAAPLALNEDFVKCVPSKRIHNVQTNDALWCHVNNHVVARRMVTRNAAGRIL